jgi:hypothetical protein
VVHEDPDILRRMIREKPSEPLDLLLVQPSFITSLKSGIKKNQAPPSGMPFSSNEPVALGFGKMVKLVVITGDPDRLTG